MVSSGGRVVTGAGDDVRATVASTGSCSNCIDASTLSFEYSWESPVAKSTRVPPRTTITSAAVMPAYDSSGPRRQRRWPVTAQETRSATVSVCTAATSDPTRELMTPVARNS